MYNIIADIAGQFKTLQALIAKMPAGQVISVGDMIDRGPRSREVVEYFMGAGRIAIKGNHEDMCVDFYRDNITYSASDWIRNGGDATLSSWAGEVDRAAVDWMSQLPLYKEIEIGVDTYFVSHAFVRWDRQGLNASPESLMWNRSEPVANNKYRLQICGHNSQFGLRWWGNPGHSVCLDGSRNRVLIGINLPTGDIYEQEYID